MILVLLGTNPYSFSRLAKAVDAYAKGSGEEVFIQLGHTDYIPLYADYVRFLPKQALLERIKGADIVVTQGGFGAIGDCLLVGKKVVAAPRRPEFRESPDRQEELVRELEGLGRLIAVYDIDDLPEAIERAGECEFKHDSENTVRTLIQDFIETH